MALPPAYSPRPDLLSAKQFEKLGLEIKSLQKKNRRQFMPVITALISVTGLVVSVIIFGYQQSIEQEKNRTARELERRTTLQNQIRGDIDEILRFTGDSKLSVSRAAFLLADIQTTLDSPINRTSLDPADKENKKLADVLHGYKDSLNRSLAILVKDDCDFTRHSRDAGLANAVVAYWHDYPDYLAKESEDFDKLNYILWKYVKALQTLHDRNPGYLESFYVDKNGLWPGRRFAKRINQDLLYRRLIGLTDGFRMHLAILCKDGLRENAKELRTARLEEFQTSLSNPVLSHALLSEELQNKSCGDVR